MTKTMQQLNEEYDAIQDRLDTAWYYKPRWAIDKAEAELAAWIALNPRYQRT